jgi:hypothetical protein
MKTAMRALGAGVVVMGLVACAGALAGDEKKDAKNLAENGGFEDVREGMPVGWFTVCNDGGTVTHKAIAEGAKEGKHCLQLKFKGEWAVAGSPKVKIDRTKTYSLTGFAKVKESSVTIKIDYYKGDEYLGHSESEHSMKGEWTQLKVESDLDGYKEATHILFAAVIHGDGEAWFDGFVLTAK